MKTVSRIRPSIGDELLWSALEGNKARLVRDAEAAAATSS